MNIGYIVSSLPPLRFGEPPPVSRERFNEIAGAVTSAEDPAGEWKDLETQLRNAIAVERRADAVKRPSRGCSVYWRNRIAACFRENDIAKRDEMIDRVWWDAAGELTPPESPLGEGALATYSVRLSIALKRARISKERGNSAFDRLTSATKNVI